MEINKNIDDSQVQIMFYKYCERNYCIDEKMFNTILRKRTLEMNGKS